MSTPAQIAANIANAQSSTGPRTQAGKAASSQNGVKLGLFTAGDFVRPVDQTAYDELNAELLHDLTPVGILERNLVDEIRRAMWRLRRCGEVEAHLVIGLDDGTGFIFDPMETTNAEAEKVQKSVDRARAQAHRLLHKCTAELSKLQTNRQIAKEFLREAADASDTGIADMRAVTRVKRRNNVIPIDQKAVSETDTVPVTTQTQSVA